MSLLPATTPRTPQPPDSLEELSNLLTEQLKKWDCFDFDIPMRRLNAMKRVIVGRDLEWRNMEFAIIGTGETFVFDGVATLVVGVQGADFEDHERRR